MRGGESKIYFPRGYNMKKTMFLVLACSLFLFGHDQQTQPQPAITSDYILGPFDQISVIVGEFQDQFSDKTFRLDGQGDVSLPLIGRIHAAGLSLHALEDAIADRLTPVLKHPDVVVNVTEITSQSVSVLGAVKNPGIQKLYGTNNLFNVLSLAGGLSENAGTTVKITRDSRWGILDNPDTIVDASGKSSTVIIHIKGISESGTNSLTIMPGDTIFVPKAAVVYAVGDVPKPGGFPIGETESLSVLQVVSLAGGLTKTAASDKAKILRVIAG